MTHASDIVARFQNARPSERVDMHADLVRRFGKGFADCLRDLVESDELIRENERNARELAGPARGSA